MPSALPLLVAAMLGAGPAAELMAVDASWDAAVASRDEAGFLARVAPDAVFAGASSLHVGRDAVRAAWARYLTEGGPTLRWTPSDSGVAASGDLGWTIGDAWFSWKEKGVAPSPGRYVTVWSREASGRWVAVLDSSLVPTPLKPGARTALREVRSRDGSMEASIGTWERGEGPSRRTGTFLTVRNRVGGEWQTVVDSEVEAPPSR